LKNPAGPAVASGILKEPRSMNTAIYVGLSRQMTLQRALDIAANNIANLDTAGFKLESQVVREEALTPPGAEAPVSYVLDYGVARDFGQGALTQTGAPLDVAIEGDAFFSIETPAGVRYTRDGRFMTDAQNRLVTKDGYPVLGAGGRPITVNPAAGELHIADDGAASQGQANVGRLEVVRFADLSKLSKDGSNLFSAPQDVVGVPAPDARLRQGMIEASNVKPVIEITNLIEITRAYERVTKMVEQAGELTSRAIDRLGRLS
jgi:flagellar basal-body rod protein FlgF